MAMPGSAPGQQSSIHAIRDHGSDVVEQLIGIELGLQQIFHLSGRQTHSGCSLFQYFLGRTGGSLIVENHFKLLHWRRNRVDVLRFLCDMCALFLPELVAGVNGTKVVYRRAERDGGTK
jgi:hypothetical protein